MCADWRCVTAMTILAMAAGGCDPQATSTCPATRGRPAAKDVKHSLAWAWREGERFALSSEVVMAESRPAGRDGQARALTSTLGFGMEVAIGKGPAPAARAVEVSCRRVWMTMNADGQVRQADTARPETLKDEEAAAQVRGMAGWSVTLSGGDGGRLTVRKPAGGGMGGAEDFAFVPDMVRRIAAYLPPAPVAVGARWTVHRQYTSMPLSMTFGGLVEDVECRLARVSPSPGGPMAIITFTGSTRATGPAVVMPVTGEVLFDLNAGRPVSARSQMVFKGPGQVLTVAENTLVGQAQ